MQIRIFKDQIPVLSSLVPFYSADPSVPPPFPDVVSGVLSQP